MKELEFILDLMNEENELETIKKIKKKLGKEVGKEYIKTIIETNQIPNNAVFLPGSKTILLSTENIMKYLKKLEQIVVYDFPGFTKEEIKLTRLLTIYRILLHEIYHSKQIYNAFDTDINDLETEIIRTLYSFTRKEYLQEKKFKTREQIIEEKTGKINRILMPYDEINPLERKAEIESLNAIRNLLKPVKGKYSNAYNEIYCQELFKKINGYDVCLSSETISPYAQTLSILQAYNIKSFQTDENQLIYRVRDKSTEQEKMKLGLKVSRKILVKTENKIHELLGTE